MSKTIVVNDKDDYRSKLANINDGDIVYMEPGLYTGVEMTIHKNDIRILARVPGEVVFGKGSHIKVKGNRVVISGIRFVKITRTPIIGFYGSTGSKLIDSAFYDCGNMKTRWRHIVQIGRNSSKISIENNYFEGSRAMSIGVKIRNRDDPSTKHEIKNNIFSTFPYLIENGTEAIQIGQKIGGPEFNSTQILVKHNLFYRVNSDPEIISLKSSNNIVTENLFIDSKGSLVLRSGHNNVVSKNCFMFNNLALRIYGSNHRITNNIFYKNKRAIALFDGGGTHVAASDLEFKSNYFIENETIFWLTAKKTINSKVPARIRVTQNYTDEGNIGISAQDFSGIQGLTLEGNTSINDSKAENKNSKWMTLLKSHKLGTLQISPKIFCSAYLRYDFNKSGPRWMLWKI